MALTNAQLEARILTIEEKLNEIQAALLNLVTSKQMKALANVRQKEILDLQAKIATLEAQVATLQSS